MGRGAVVYAPCRSSCPTLLTLEDGRTYGLGARTVHPQGNITLSPDGRWLAFMTNQRTDVSGTARGLGLLDLAAWHASPAAEEWEYPRERPLV